MISFAPTLAPNAARAASYCEAAGITRAQLRELRALDAQTAALPVQDYEALLAGLPDRPAEPPRVIPVPPPASRWPARLGDVVAQEAA